VDKLNVAFEVKTINEEGSFTGYAAIFNNVDLGGDKIIPGAFKKTLRANKGKVPVYADHHTHIGWNLKAKEDEKGLLVEGQINLDVQLGREKHALMKQAHEIGAQIGLSIGYSTAAREYEKDVRILKELNLFEYSVTAIPMNPKASVTAVKNKDGNDELVLNFKEETITDVRSLEAALRDAGVSKSKAQGAASIVFGRCDTDNTEGLKDVKESMDRIANIFKS
jgi:hypothetical protein